MEEKKNNSKNILIAFLTVLVLGLGGFIIYDKVIDKKEESKQTENTTNNDSTNKNEFEKESDTKDEDQSQDNNDIENNNTTNINYEILSLIIFKRDSYSKLFSYNRNNIDSKDINDIICNYVVANGKYDENYEKTNGGMRWTLDETTVNNAIKFITDKTPDLSKGLNVYLGVHTLTKDGSNYKVQRQDDIQPAMSNLDMIHIGGIESMQYRNKEVILKVKVKENISETDAYRYLGTVELIFDTSNGFKFKSLNVINNEITCELFEAESSLVD